MGKKAKLLIVSPTPPPMSGPEIMTRHLLNSTLKEGYELVHFNISKNRDINSKAKIDLVNVFYGLIQPLQLFVLLIKYRPTAMYTNMAQTTGGFFRYASFIWIASFFKVPVVTRVMGDGFGHFFHRVKYQSFVQATMDRVDRVIVRADLLKKQFEGIVPKGKMKVVYSGIETQDFRRDDLRRETNGKLTFLFVGYLTQAKGAFDLLKVIPEIVEEEPEVSFRFMGARLKVERNIVYIDGVERPQDEILDELLEHEAIKSHCEFLGVLSGDAKVKEFVSADALVFPSHSEAFPTVVLEAMAAGLPIISTPAGVLPEAFDERSILFNDIGDLEALKSSILRMIREEKLRKEMSAFNLTEVNRDYTIDAYGNRVRRLFDELLAS